MASSDYNDLLDTSAAARILGITESLVRRYCRRGLLGKPVADRWVISKEDLKEFRKKPRKVGRPSRRKSA